jgi:uncharacterized membrane protein
VKRAKYIAIAVILALAVGGIVLARNTTQFAAATSYQPEQFSELYFTNPDALPSTTVSGKTYSVPFTIVNHEAGKKTYDYEITASDATGVYKVKSGSVTLAVGGRSVQSFNLAPARAATSQTLVTVHLLNLKPTIAFRTQL